ncbi:MAG: glycosyltransferase family 39 protein [Wenzhouxiangellaceae bacterium]|nr:glycosyltransferase family 39 protein [Wenzhouxiangellaceae bacterium]
MRPYGDRTAAGPGTTPPLAARVHPRPLIATLLLAAFLLLPSMASVGMFFDGAIYASVSRNLADGIGSPWAPHFSDGLFPVFREHPPLVFWLQAMFFRALGDSYLTERAYDLTVVLLSAWLLWLLWRRLAHASGSDGLVRYYWLPMLMWVVGPVWSWAYRNNLLENTMTLLCLAAALLVFDALRTRIGRGWAPALVAGAFTLAAFLAKGPTALFVLVCPLLFGPALRVPVRRTAAVAAIHWATATALFGALIALVPEARETLAASWARQVGARAGLDFEGLAILLELAKKLAPMVLVVGALAIAARDRARAALHPVRRPAAALLATGAAASMPLVLGDLDSAHYLVPALPFYALGFGLAGAALLDAVGPRTRARLSASPGTGFTLLSALAALAIVLMSAGRIGEPRKNVAYHELFSHVSGMTGRGATLGLDPALYSDWTLHAVAQRHYRLSLDPEATGSPWRLVPALSGPPPGFEERVLEHGEWVLWR